MSIRRQNPGPSKLPRQPRSDCIWCGVCGKYRTLQYWTSSEAFAWCDECSYAEQRRKQSSRGGANRSSRSVPTSEAKKTVPIPAMSSRKATGHVTSTQRARQNKFQEPRKTEKERDMCGKKGALKDLMTKADPILCISCAAMQFRAEAAPNREPNAVPIDNYVPKASNDTIYRGTLHTRNRVLRLEKPSGSIQDLLQSKKKTRRHK